MKGSAMTKKTIVTIEYNLDDVLEHHMPTLNGETMKAADALRKETFVRTWYMDHYPTDPMGDDIEGRLSWYDLLERMRCGEEFYDIIGVCDSMIRERCFAHLAKLTVLPYEAIYRTWL